MLFCHFIICVIHYISSYLSKNKNIKLFVFCSWSKPQIFNRGRYSIRNMNQHLTIRQPMFFFVG